MPDDDVVYVTDTVGYSIGVDIAVSTDTVVVQAVFRSPVTCAICSTVHERPPYLTMSMFKQCGFVCENCRCKSCSIVLHSECQCGEFHAEPSPEDPSICLECIAIRKRVANIAPELCYSRMSDIADEEPLYCYATRKQENENEFTGE